MVKWSTKPQLTIPFDLVDVARRKKRLARQLRGSLSHRQKIPAKVKQQNIDSVYNAVKKTFAGLIRNATVPQ